MRKALLLLTVAGMISGLTTYALVPSIFKVKTETSKENVFILKKDHLQCVSIQEESKGKAVSAINSPARQMSKAETLAQTMRYESAVAPINESEEAEVIFDQDFSLLTEGSETEPGPSLIPSPITSLEDYFISAEYMGEEGWLGYGVRSAGGCLALSQPTSYGYNAGGWIDTPVHNLYGRVFIKFRAKVIPKENGEDVSAGFFVSCAINNLAPYPTGVNNIPATEEGASVRHFTLKASEGWQEVNMMVYNPYQGEDCFVQVNCSYPDTGLLIDDLVVSRDNVICLPPTNLLSYDFTNDGFTARWEPGANNASYLMTLIEQTEDGEPQSTSVDFDNIIIDDNGKITSLTDLKGIEVYLSENYGTMTEGFEGSGAVILTSDNDGIILPDLNLPITECSLFLKANVSYNSLALLYITGEYQGLNIVIGSISLTNAIEGGIFNIERYVEDFGSYNYFMFLPFGLSPGESIIVDNIDWTVSAPFKEETIFEDRPVDSNIVVLTDLNPENEYFFAVKGVSREGMISGQTEFRHALGCPPPVVLEASEVNFDEGSYVANWEPSVKAIAYEVSNFEQKTIENATENYVVLFDDFDGASDPSGMGIELNGYSFDGLADTNGWTSSMGIYSESAIGAYYNADVTSPYMSLGNDNGRFKVKVMLSGFPGTQIVVQCNTSSFQVATIPDYDNEDMLYNELYEFNFEDGKELTQLMFYNPVNMDAFLIQYIEVTQNVNPEDKVLTFMESKLVDGHDTDSCEFTGLLPSEEYDYAYTVTAYGRYLGLDYSSDPSEIKAVKFENTSIESVAVTDKIRVIVGDNNIIVSLPMEAEITLYDINGHILKKIKGEIGINDIAVENGGVYIVKVNDLAKKVIVIN